MLATSNNQVHACKPIVNSVATELYSLAEFQFGQVDGGKLKIHGIESSGQNLLVFSEDDVYVISGEGPDAEGGTSRFTDARILLHGQGSVEDTVHICYPKGVLYQSQRGFYQINRELQHEYIGAPVENFGAYRALAVEVDDSKNEIYIVLGNRLDSSADATGFKTVLVYNYFFDTWSQYNFDNAYVTYNSKGLAMLNGQLFYGRVNKVSYSGRSLTASLTSLSTGGGGQYPGVYQVSKTKFQDLDISGNYSKFSTVIETPFIYTNEIQGAQRVYKVQFLGDYKDDHDITVDMTVDYDTNSTHTQTKTASDLTDKHVYQVPVKRQKNRAIKIKHTIAPNSSSSVTSELFRMDGMALEIGMRPTTFALSKGDKL